MNYRPTFAEIYLGAIRRNTERIIKKYSGFKHYTAVVKADCYGYRGFSVVKAMLDGGADMLAASLLEEGVSLRREFPFVPVMLFTPVLKEQLSVCVSNNLIVTVASLSDAEEAAAVKDLDVIIRINGGSDILGGPTDKETFNGLFYTVYNGKCNLKGVYLHAYNAEEEETTLKEYKMYSFLTDGLPVSELEYVSVENSLTLPRYIKREFSNTCRLGNIIYGIESDDGDLENTFVLKSKVLTVFTMKKGESLAYSHAYTCNKEKEYVAAVPIGFGDGFSKTNIGRFVYINDKRYKIVAVTMDITHILVDENIKKGDEVVLIRDNRHLDEISEHTGGATEEPVCALNKRVERIYFE